LQNVYEVLAAVSTTTAQPIHSSIKFMKMLAKGDINLSTEHHFALTYGKSAYVFSERTLRIYQSGIASLNVKRP
jgi:hypothetical protein